MSTFGTRPNFNGNRVTNLHVKQQAVLRCSVRYLRDHEKVLTRKGEDHRFPDNADANEKQVHAGDAVFSYVRGFTSDVNESGVTTVDNGETVPLVFNHMSGGSRHTRTQFRGITIDSNVLTDHDTEYEGAMAFQGEIEAWCTSFRPPCPGKPMCCAMVDGSIEPDSLEIYNRACRRGKLQMGHWFHLEDILVSNDPTTLDPQNPSDYVIDTYKALHRPMILYTMQAISYITENTLSLAARTNFGTRKAAIDAGNLNGFSPKEATFAALDNYASDQVSAGLNAIEKYLTPPPAGTYLSAKNKKFNDDHKTSFTEAKRHLEEVPNALFEYNSLFDPADYNRQEFNTPEAKRLLFNRKLNTIFGFWMSGFRRVSLMKKGGLDDNLAFAHYLGQLVTAIQLMIMKYGNGSISSADYTKETKDATSEDEFMTKRQIILDMNIPNLLESLNALYALNAMRFKNGLDVVLRYDYVGLCTKPLNTETNFFAIWMEGKAATRA